MPRMQYYQCLLFVVHEKDSAILPKLSGYALLPGSFKSNHPEACQKLADEGVIILEIENEPPSFKNVEKVEMIELLVPESLVKNSMSLDLHVCSCNKDSAERLLSKGNHTFHFVETFRRKSYTFISAVQEKNLMALERFSVVGFDNISYGHPLQGTLLQFALELDYTSLREFLIMHGVNLEARNNVGKSVLHLAAETGHEEWAKRLLDCGADAFAVKLDGTTPLHLAVKSRNVRIAELLLEKGAIVDARKKDGSTPLHIASVSGCGPMVTLLLQRGADANAQLQSDVVGRRHLGGTGTSLHLAIMKKRPAIVKLLLENGKADVNVSRHFDGAVPLSLAYKYKLPEILDIILHHCPNLEDENNKKAFRHIVCDSYDYDGGKTVDKLVKYGFTVNATDAQNPDLLRGAIKNNSFELVKKLLDHGAEVNQQISDKMWCYSDCKCTPLHFAAGFAEENIIKLLLDRGANVNTGRFTPETPGRPFFERSSTNRNQRQIPLYDAIHHGNMKAVEILVANDKRILDDPELLCFAAHWNHPLILEFLLDHGVRVNTLSPFKEITPLMAAIDCGRRDLVPVLLKFGARTDLICKDDQSVWSFAIVGPQTDVLCSILDRSFTDINLIEHITMESFFDMESYFEIDEGWRPGGVHYDDAYSCMDDGDFWLHYEERALIFAHHLLRMEAAYENFSSETLIPKRLYEDHQLMTYKRACFDEIHRLKRFKIGSSHVSLYDILTRDVSRLSHYAKNDCVIETLHNVSMNEFPKYSNIIQVRFQMGRHRRKLLDHGRKIFTALIRLNVFAFLPENLVDKILNYFDNQDLLILINLSSRVFGRQIT